MDVNIYLVFGVAAILLVLATAAGRMRVFDRFREQDGKTRDGGAGGTGGSRDAGDADGGGGE